MYLMYYRNALCFGNSSNTPYTRKEYLKAGTYQLTIPSDITELMVTGCGGGAGGVTLGAYNQSPAITLQAGNGGDTKVGSFIISGGKGALCTLTSGNVMTINQPNASVPNGVKGDSKQARNLDFTLHGSGFSYGDNNSPIKAEIINTVGYYYRRSNTINDTNYKSIGTVDGYGIYGAGGGTYHFYDSDGVSNQIGVAGNSGAFVVKEKVPVIPESVIDIIVGDGGKHAFYSNDGDGAFRFRVSDGTHGFVIVEYGTSTLYSAEY